MGRLIDVDDIIRIGDYEFSEDDMSKIRWLIAHIPTAYDVDKVIEAEEEFLINYGVPKNTRVHQKIINIIRSGVNDTHLLRFFG